MPSASALFTAAPPASAGTPAVAPDGQAMAADAAAFMGKLAEILQAGLQDAKIQPKAHAGRLALAALHAEVAPAPDASALAETAVSVLPIPPAAPQQQVVEDVPPEGANQEEPAAEAQVVQSTQVVVPVVSPPAPAAAPVNADKDVEVAAAPEPETPPPAVLEAAASSPASIEQPLVTASEAGAPEVKAPPAQATASILLPEAAAAPAQTERPAPVKSAKDIASDKEVLTARNEQPSAQAAPSMIQPAVPVQDAPAAVQPASPSMTVLSSEIVTLPASAPEPQVETKAPAVEGASPVSAKEIAPTIDAPQQAVSVSISIVETPKVATMDTAPASEPSAPAPETPSQAAVAEAKPSPRPTAPAKTEAAVAALLAQADAFETAVDEGDLPAKVEGAPVSTTSSDDLADMPAPPPVSASVQPEALRPLRHDDRRSEPRAALDVSSDTTKATGLSDAPPSAVSTPSSPAPATPATTAEATLPPPVPTAPAAIDASAPLLSAAQAAAPQPVDHGLGLSTLSRATVETTAQLAAQIARRLEGRSTRFDMVLTPEDLGRVDVSLEIGSDGQLSARLAFDNPAAAADLRGRADELRRQLQDAGFQVSGDSLDFAQRDPSSGGGFERQQQRNALFAGGSRLAVEADLPPVPAPGAWINRSLTPERVDLKV